LASIVTYLILLLTVHI